MDGTMEKTSFSRNEKAETCEVPLDRSVET
jgi:hypothetical protein